MKLRNKKTGEIIETLAKISFVEKHSGIKCFDSIDLLNEEWEDYEEPKDFWYIDVECGVMCDSTDTDLQDKRYPIEFMKSIGNYFETKEEAEKAVEKLKALKRLKDKGFSITLQCRKGYAWLEANWGNLEGDYSDVLLLFGGKI